MLENTWYYRVVAASPVSPVSTKPLFPSLVACLVSTISIAQQTLMQGPQARRWHVETSSKGVVCKIHKRSESWNQYCMTQWAESLDIHICETVNWPTKSIILTQNGLRSNSIASQFRRSIPLDPPTCSQLFMHALRTWLFKFDGYGHVLLLAVECLTFIGINSKSMYSLMMERWRRWKVMVSGVVCRLWLLRPNRTSSLSREKWGSCVARPNIIWWENKTW